MASLVFAERHEEAEALAVAAAQARRLSSRPFHLGTLLGAVSYGMWLDGRWDEAVAVLEEARTLAAQTGEELLSAVTAALLARIAAARGDGEQVDALLATRPPAAAALGTFPWYALAAEGLAHLGAGQPRRAVGALEELRGRLIDAGVRNPNTVAFHGDLIDALVEVGDEGRAAEVLAELEFDAAMTGLRWPRGIVARGRARLARGPAADRLFGASLLIWDRGFDGARTRLAWARSLRGRDGAGRAAGLLVDAAATFDRLGARPWADQARLEAVAAGAPIGEGRPAPLAALTAQELQVALAVANGRTNAEAAAELFMSPKTVEHHLTHTYAKLGLRSRTQLVRLVAAASGSKPRIGGAELPIR